MNLDIRYRCINLLFVEKELKVLLEKSATGGYHCPEASVVELTDDHQFVGMINRMPVVEKDINYGVLTINCYILNKTKTDAREAAKEKWFAIDEAMALDEDTAAMISKTLQQLKKELHYSPIAYYLLPQLFTMQELCGLYEIILNKTLNRGNFYRKMMRVGILTLMGKQKTGRPHKSPSLYAFNEIYCNTIENGLFQEF
jgi:hypothetical protein